MPRKRTVAADFFSDERFETLPLDRPFALLALFGVFDREGRARDQPRRLARAIRPYDPTFDLEPILKDLSETSPPIIVRYEVDEERYLWIPEWFTTWAQRPHAREVRSTIPRPPQDHPRRAKGSPADDPGSTKVRPGHAEGEPSDLLGAPSDHPGKPIGADAPTVFNGEPVASKGAASKGKDEKAILGSTEGKPSDRPGRAEGDPKADPGHTQDQPRSPDPDPDPDPEREAVDVLRSRSRSASAVPFAAAAAAATELVGFLRREWPGAFEDPHRSVMAWTEAFPGLDLLAETKKARAKQIATGQKREIPAGYLHAWFERAKAELDARAKNSRDAPAGESKSPATLALERKSREDDEREAAHRETVGKGDSVSRRAHLAALRAANFGVAK